MEYQNTDHTFAVCAYKESPYLESCIKSLVNQKVKSNIIVCTSTPCEFIENMAKKYDLPYYVREGKSDICDDWNFSVACTKTNYVTVAHQDDVYNEHYVEELLKHIPDEKMSIFIADYLPLKGGKVGKRDINSKLRKFLRQPMRCKKLAASKWWRRRILSLGNSICCPGVTYNKSVVGLPIFTSKMTFCIDWDTFLKCAEIKNSHFAYCDTPIIYYRIHDGATSKEFIVDHRRIKEDTDMFNKFWPSFLTKIIMVFYKRAYDTYN